MKKLFIFLICLFFASPVWAISPAILGNLGQSSGGGGVVDYTADANCMGAWFMNGGLSANGDNETDRSTAGTETLTEDGGDIPNSATVPAGYSGSSRDFNDVQTERLYHADGGNTDISGADQSISLCCWYKKHAAGLADDNYLIAKYTTSLNHRQYALKYDDSDAAVHMVLSSDGTVFTSCVGATDIDDGSWHHVCGVYDDTDMRVYIDGALDNNGVNNPKTYSAGMANKNGHFNIGCWKDAPDKEADGLIDEVIVLDRALSAAEVLDIKTNGIDGTKGAND